MKPFSCLNPDTEISFTFIQFIYIYLHFETEQNKNNITYRLKKFHPTSHNASQRVYFWTASQENIFWDIIQNSYSDALILWACFF